MRYKVLKVICDSSKPLLADLPFFDVMIGRTDKVTVSFFQKERPYSFNLAERPLLADSKDHAGLQIADVIASVAAAVFKQGYRGEVDPDSDKWLAQLSKHFLDDNIWPDLSLADITSREGLVNAVVLQYLLDCSEKGEDIFSRIGDVVRFAFLSYPQFMREQGAKPTKSRKTSTAKNRVKGSSEKAGSANRIPKMGIPRK